MDLQYISDTQGRHTAVVIPIDEWNNLTSKHQDLKLLEKPEHHAEKKPSDFIGSISKETAQQMIADLELSRNEWERDI